MHHATAGDLDRRFTGDVPTYTVAEYEAWNRPTRLAYRMFRNPFVMFGVGPIWAMLIEPRLVRRTHAPRIKRSTIVTNIALLLVIGGLCLLIGWKAFVLVEAPFVFLAGGTGIWLFYVQHQFDGVYWERTDDWSYEDAAVKGSSYLKLPKVLQFFTGNIGLHHAHHLSAKIPNYYLQRAHDGIPMLHKARTMSFWDGIRATRFKLIDEEGNRLLTWRQLRARKRPALV